MRGDNRDGRFGADDDTAGESVADAGCGSRSRPLLTPPISVPVWPSAARLGREIFPADPGSPPAAREERSSSGGHPRGTVGPQAHRSPEVIVTISTGLDRRSAIALALMMPLGPLCIAALRGVMPTFSSTDAAAVADSGRGRARTPERRDLARLRGASAARPWRARRRRADPSGRPAVDLVGDRAARPGVLDAGSNDRRRHAALVRPHGRAGHRRPLRAPAPRDHRGDRRLRGRARGWHGPARAGATQDQARAGRVGLGAGDLAAT